MIVPQPDADRVLQWEGEGMLVNFNAKLLYMNFVRCLPNFVAYLFLFPIFILEIFLLFDIAERDFQWDQQK